VESGDGRTEDRGGLPRNEENVIRLPRDWLGPPEELVPIGSAARARAAQRDPEHDMPPAADAFWSEDSAALHDALEAPDPGVGERHAPPVGLVEPVAGLRLPRAIRLPHLGALRSRGAPPWRWSLSALGAVVLSVAAVIGTSEGPVPHRMPSQIRVSHSAMSPDLTASTDAAGAGAGAGAGAEKAAAARHPRAQSRRHRAMSRAHTRARGRHVAKPHHRAVTKHSAAASPSTVTHATTSPPPTQSSTPTTSTAPSASTASTVASTGSRPVTGPAGPTQLGSMTGGCLPKCK
jgi:hypothetical protein